MPYNANIPLATDKLSASQVDINNNFQGINTYVSVDHVPFANTANQGKHQMVTFPISAAPAVSVAGFIGLYGANDAAGNPQIWVNNVAPAHQIPMTAGSLMAEGWSYLPSGLIMKWGAASVDHGSGPLHNFPTGVGIPVFAALVSIQLTGIYVSSGDNSALWVASATTTGFTPASNSFAKNCYYLAIGY